MSPPPLPPSAACVAVIHGPPPPPCETWGFLKKEEIVAGDRLQGELGRAGPWASVRAVGSTWLPAPGDDVMGPSAEPPAREPGRKPGGLHVGPVERAPCCPGAGGQFRWDTRGAEEPPAHLHPPLPAGVSWTLLLGGACSGQLPRHRGPGASPPFPGATLSWDWLEEGPQDFGLGGPSAGRSVGSPALAPTVEGGPTHGGPQGLPGGHWTLHWRLLARTPSPNKPNRAAEVSREGRWGDTASVLGHLAASVSPKWGPVPSCPWLPTQGAGRGLWQHQVLGICWSAAVWPGEATPGA